MPFDEGNVVMEKMIGNSRVMICDDYCRDRTPEEVQAILKRIARRALEAFNRPAYEKEKEC